MNPLERLAEAIEAASDDLITELGVFLAALDAGAADEAEVAREEALSSASALVLAASAVARRLNEATMNPRRAEVAE